jgi:alkylation response protein AidB-like acyl-CoA dehydrogenase
VDEEARWPQECAALLETDFYAPHVPEEYGGVGADALATVIVIEEIARADVSASLIPAVNKLGSLPVQIGGSEELKKKYLGALARGEGGFSYCLSEPDAGSDAANQKTRAVRDGDGWVLKRWISNAGESEFYVLAMTDPDKRSKGISAFVVVRRGRLLRGQGEEAGHPARRVRSTWTTSGSPVTGLSVRRARASRSR